MTARDVSPSWKPATVRLATYSGAPVDFAVYPADPEDVLIAGSSTARALDTSHRQAAARWRYTPPPGFRFQENDIQVPLGSREGFFVVEARRGDASEQVWLNRTRLGLLTKEGPLGLLVWFADLQSGRAQPNVHAEFLVGRELQARTSDGNGLIDWRGSGRPRFVLASSGSSKAFVSLLPQSPLPQAIVSVRGSAGSLRAGETLKLFGFARRRISNSLRPASGDVQIALSGGGRTLAATSARLDAAGAFSAEIAVPANAAAGDYAVLASTAGATGAVSLHIDAAADVALAISANCPCSGDREIAVTVSASRRGAPVSGVPVRLQVVRSPHIAPPGGDENAAWGITQLSDRSLRTDAEGRARAVLPAPSDGLASTYALRATTTGASASARVVAPTAPFALAIEPARTSANPGDPVSFQLRGFDARDGAPRAGLTVNVRASHGTNAQTRAVTLDDRGRGFVEFRSLPLGTNLITADAAAEGARALDATAVTIEPGSLASASEGTVSDVRITLDRARVKPNEKVTIHASLRGASGDALLSIDGAKAYAVRVASVSAGSAQATLDAGDPQGDVRAAAVFIRDGAFVTSALPLDIDGPGHVRATTLTLDRATLAPGEAARVQVHDGSSAGAGTLALTVTDGRPSGSQSFGEAPSVLLAGGTVTQYPAAENPAWHTFVAPASSRASDIYAAERPRRLRTEPPVLGAASPVTDVWRVERASSAPLDVQLPAQRGAYVISVLMVNDEGDVGSASATVTVR